jgi:hypothetical protein
MKFVDTWDPEIQWIQCFPRAYASGRQVHIGTAAQRLGQVVGSKDALSHGINQWLEDTRLQGKSNVYIGIYVYI